MQQKHAILAFVLRLIGVLTIIVAGVVAALPAQVTAVDPRIAVWMGCLGLLGIATVLLALASLLRREAQIPPEAQAAITRIQQQSIEIHLSLKDLHRQFDLTVRGQPAPATPAKDYTRQIEYVAASIASLRELMLLPDADRRQLLQSQRMQRKTSALKELFNLISAHEWLKAERLLITLETEFPNDDEVAKGRSHLSHIRNLFEEETMVRTIREVEDLVAAGKWNQALDQAQQLRLAFPTSSDAQVLLSRVEREHEIHCETAVQQMIDQIRIDIDHRAWRQALQHAQRLIELHPQHRLVDSIRDKLPTLQANAEIEERQSLEIRIQECIRDRQFEDAIDLSEDLIRRYPNSPQADSLDKLLPRLHELARPGMNELSGVKSDPANPFLTDEPIQEPTAETPK